MYYMFESKLKLIYGIKCQNIYYFGKDTVENLLYTYKNSVLPLFKVTTLSKNLDFNICQMGG